MSQNCKRGEQKTLQHFFSKQTETCETRAELRTNGSQEEPLVICDSSDEEDGRSASSTNRKLVRKLFTPSPENEVSFKNNEGKLKFEPVHEPGAFSSSIPQGVVISPIKEPNIDFNRDDTDDIMGSLPDPTPERKQAWTPEADTFEKLLEKIRRFDLLPAEDNLLLDKFEKTSKQTQNICLRLYQRKHKWILRSKITYKVEDIDASLADAVANGFLQDKTDLNDLDHMLKLLSLKETLILRRKFCDTKTTSKAAAIEALLAHANRKDVLFGGQRIRQNIVKGAQELLEQCYFIVPRFAEVATRVLTLFSLGSHFDTFMSAVDRNEHGCCHIFTIGQYLRGTFKFPEHETQSLFGTIFKSADDFRLYSDARLRHFRVLRAIESNAWDDAMRIFEENFHWFLSKYSPEKFKEDASWPQFLHRFTFTYCFLRCLASGADIFERQRRYKEACDLYFTILSQRAFMHNRRGLYWHRLLLDVDVHLKKPRNSLAMAHLALRDSIFDQQKYDIFNRAKRLSERFKVRISSPMFPVAIEAPIEYISGKLMQREIIGRKNVFASVDSTGERVVGPEAVAIEHYLNHGFTRGVHGETPTMLMLFALLSWDTIFGSPSEAVPDQPSRNLVALTESAEAEVIREVFSIDLEDEDASEPKLTTQKRKRGASKKRKADFQPVTPLEHTSVFYKPVQFPEIGDTPKDDSLMKTVYVSEFQSGPLDLGYAEFFPNRKRAVGNFLDKLGQMSSDDIISAASTNYKCHHGKLNPLFAWEVLSEEEALTLLRCIPTNVLVGIFRQLLTDFRFYRSGFPDIIMWNEEKREWKVVEVKGPGDTLSTKQRYWMHLLISLNVDCVTCRVTSVHNRKIRSESSD